MDINNFVATKVDASSHWMHVEFGDNTKNEGGDSISAPGDTAYGRYIKYIILRHTKNGAGKVAYRFLGIIPIETKNYLMHINETLNIDCCTWRPNTSNEFRKLMIFARKMEKIKVVKDDEAFPYIEKHFKEYFEAMQIQKITR